MNGTGSPPDTGATTEDDRAADRTAALRALVIAALLGAAIWAAGWSWNAPFTPDAGADTGADTGMFTDHHGALRAIGCVITIPAVAAIFSYRGHPYAGALGVSLGFGLLWSVDAYITSYNNVFVGLGIGAMWVCVGAGTALASWNAQILRRDQQNPRQAFNHGLTPETDALTRWRNLRRGTSHR